MSYSNDLFCEASFNISIEILLESFQKNHFLNLIKQEVDSLKGQVAYAKDKVNYKGTPDWEKKEFAAILKDKIKDLKDTEKHYKRVQKLKEGKLTEAKGKWAVINANDVLNIFAEKVVDTQKEAEKIAKQMKQKDRYGKYQAVSVKRWNQAGKGKKIKEGKLTEKVNQSKVNQAFTKGVAAIRKISRTLNDDDNYAFIQKLEKWLK